MKTYSHFGVNDFIICLGYKGYVRQGITSQTTVCMALT